MNITYGPLIPINIFECQTVSTTTKKMRN